MFRLGICTRNQYEAAGKKRRFLGPRVAYSLLKMGENPTKEQIEIFEDISFTLGTSNGTYRTTFRNRLRDVDAATIKMLQRLYPSDFALSVEDRAVSHGLTSLELAQCLFEVFPSAHFEASDRFLHLIQFSLASGACYVLEPEGQPLQFIKPPFVVSLAQKESKLLPVNRLIAAWAKRRLRRLSPQVGRTETREGEKYEVSEINCIHPEVVAYMNGNKQFQVRTRSVFEITSPGVHVLRTMNILNKDYFSETQLKEGSQAAHKSLKRGGVWIVGRTLESDFSNHVSFLQRRENGWQILGRIGNGSEMEEYVGQIQTGPDVMTEQ